MRRIIITFKQEDKDLVACTADFGNRDEASELENKLADSSKPSITTALKRLPADLVGEGYGATEQEAEQLAKLEAQPSLSRYGDSPKNPGENQVPATSRKMASRILSDHSIIRRPDCLFRRDGQCPFYDMTANFEVNDRLSILHPAESAAQRQDQRL